MAFQAGPEAGYPGNITPNWSVTATPSFQAAPDDPNLDLRFPWSVAIFDRMARTDGQVGSVLRAITLPLLGARWDLITDGVDDVVVQRVREDLGLPAPGGQVPRRRVSTVVWTEHLRQACKALLYGFGVFEQVYEVVGDPTHPEVHLRKLAPRLATTIDRILVAPDGGLEGVIQRPPLYHYLPGSQTPVMGLLLGVDRIVVYSHEREGGNWFGNSILRTSYKDFMVKDQLVRTNAQAIERNGMGVPVVTISDESQRDEATRFVQEFRAGASAGGVLPAGCTLTLVAPSGSPKDALPSIHMHNQEISQASLAMFLNLGHDVGARSLGETFVDVFTQSLQALADWFAATATEHIIADLVGHAFGPDMPYPILTPGDLSEQRVITAADLTALVGAGAVTVDSDLEAYVRKVNGLPAKPEGTPTVAVPAAAGVPAGTTVAPGAAEQRAQALMNRLQALTPTTPKKPATPTKPTAPTTGG